MSRPKILLAIPAYNCAKQIPRVLQGIDDRLLERLEQVIVIDDCGKDQTAETATTFLRSQGKLGGKIQVVRNVKNLGLGGTHKMAFLYGEQMGVDYVAILHGDDQAKAPELHRLIDAAENDPELGAVLGCRFMKGSDLVGYSWERIWGNRAINAVYSLIALRASRDLGSGLNLFRLKDLADHRYLGFDDRMTFNIDLLLEYFSKKTNIQFLPISWHETDQVSNARNFTVARTALTQLLKWRFGLLRNLPLKEAKNYRSEPYISPKTTTSTTTFGSSSQKMRDLHIILPMAGRGSRFVKAGVKTPKPLILVDGEPMFLRALKSLERIRAKKHYTLIMRGETERTYGIRPMLFKALPEAHVVFTDGEPVGALRDAYRAKPYLHPEEGIIILDCDLWFQSRAYENMVEACLAGASSIAGGLLTFPSDHPRYSYADVQEDGSVTRTAEKKVISRHAITGAYFVANAEIFTAATDEVLAQPLNAEMPEYHVSHLYNAIIRKGGTVRAAAVESSASFGTPEELAAYEHRKITS